MRLPCCLVVYLKLHLYDDITPVRFSHFQYFFPVHAQRFRRAQSSASCNGPTLVSLTVYATKHCCKLLLIDYVPVFDDMLPSNHPIASPNFWMCRAGRSTLQSTRFPMPFSVYLFPMPLFLFCCLLPRTSRQLTTTACVWYLLSPSRTVTKQPKECTNV